MEMGRIPWCAHRIPHHWLLRCGVGMVHAICICIGDRSATWQPRLHSPILRRLQYQSPATSILVVHNNRHCPFRHHTRCAQRHREGIKDPHAAIVHPTVGYRRGIMYAARRHGRSEVLVYARLLKTDQRCISRCFGTIVLLTKHRNGMYLYLCLILQPPDQPVDIGSADRTPRLDGGHPRRTDDISCCRICGSKS